MMEFSLVKLFSGVYKILKSSPSAFIFGFFGILFLISMIISIKRSKKIEKPLFIVGWIFVSVFILFRFFTSLNTMLDNFINNVFMQIFFPNLATYFIIVVLSNVIIITTFFSKKSKISDKIINTIFYILIMLLLLITLEQISKGKVNIYEKVSVYTNKNLIVLIESSTILFSFWTLLIISKLIIRKLVKKSGEVLDKENVSPVIPVYPEIIKPVEPIDQNGEVIKNVESDITKENEESLDSFPDEEALKEKTSEEEKAVSNIESQDVLEKTDFVSQNDDIEVLSLDDLNDNSIKQESTDKVSYTKDEIQNQSNLSSDSDIEILSLDDD